MGALHLVVAETEIAGVDPVTFFGTGISLVALILSFIKLTLGVRRLGIVAAGVALAEFVLLLVSMPIWVRVVIGVVLGAVGVAWMVRAGRKVSPQQTERIHAVLDKVGTALKEGSPSNLDERDAAIFSSHFPKLAKQVKAWDKAVKAVAVSEQALRTSVESELRDLNADKAPYEFETIRDGLCAITEARTAHLAVSAEPFPPMLGNQGDKPIFDFYYNDTDRIVVLAFGEASGATGDVVRFTSYPDDAAEVGEQYGRPIYNFLIVMQTWNPTKVLNAKRQKLEKFAKADLAGAVKKERDRTYYRRAEGCPDCK